MYYKKFFFLLVLCTNTVKSQSEVSGIILDANENLPVPFVNIILKGINNQNQAIGAISDENGFFSIKDVKHGEYSLTVSSIGFATYQKVLKIVESINLNSIYLEEETTELEEVVLEGKRPTMKRKVDRLVFNIQKSSLASSGSAWDALRKTPSVKTDTEGNVSAFNKSAIIMMDGRLLQLSPESISEMLKGMSAEDILEIEIITAPPAKYETSGGLIINIKRNKRLEDGYTLNTNAFHEQARFGRHLLGGSFFLKKGKLNVNASYSYLDGNFQNLDNENTFYDQPLVIWNSDKASKLSQNSNTYTMSADYEIHSNSKVGFQYNGFLKKNKSIQNVNTRILNSSSQIDSTLRNLNQSNSRTFSNSINFNFTQKLNKNSEVNIDYDYISYDEENKQDLNTDSFDNNNQRKYESALTIESEQEIRIQSAKIDYSYAFGENSRFESGIKWSNIETNNDLDYSNLINSGFIDTQILANNFRYSEDNKAGYLSINSKIKDFEFKVGVRAEFTDNLGRTDENQVTVSQKFLQVFPVGTLLYNFNENSSIDFAYTKGIIRPEYWRLNPFRFYDTPYSYSVGNPFLRPSISNSISLAYTLNNKFVFVGYYNKWKDDFTQITEQDNDLQTLIYTQINLGSSEDFGLFFIVPIKISEWWDSNFDVELSRQIDSSQYLDTSFKLTNNKIYVTTNNQFVLSKKKNWNAEISAWYSSSNLQGLFKSGSAFDVSIGTRKYFFDNKLSLSLSFDDIFWSNFTRTFVRFQDQNYNFLTRSDTQKFRVSLNYKFNGGNKGQEELENRKSTNDEKDRLKFN